MGYFDGFSLVDSDEEKKKKKQQANIAQSSDQSNVSTTERTPVSIGTQSNNSIFGDFSLVDSREDNQNAYQPNANHKAEPPKPKTEDKKKGFNIGEAVNGVVNGMENFTSSVSEFITGRPEQKIESPLPSQKPIIIPGKMSLLDRAKRLDAVQKAGYQIVGAQFKTAIGLFIDQAVKSAERQDQMRQDANIPDFSGNTPQEAQKRTAQSLDLAKQFKTAGEKDYQDSEAKRAALGQAGGLQGLAEDIQYNVPGMAFTLGATTLATLVTKNPEIGLTIGFGTSFAQNGADIYRDARNFGVNEDKAEDLGIIGGTVLGLIDIVPIGRLIKDVPGSQAVRKTLIRHVLDETISLSTQAGLEGLTEGIQQIGQNALAKTYDDHKDLFEGVAQAALVGGFLGAGSDIVINTGGGAIARIGDASIKNPFRAVQKAIQQVAKSIATPEGQRTPEQQQIADAATEVLNGAPILRETANLSPSDGAQSTDKKQTDNSSNDAQSAQLDKPLYHATTSFAADAIKEDGFKLGYENEPAVGTKQKDLGEGVYFGKSEEDVKHYGDAVVKAYPKQGLNIKELTNNELAKVYTDNNFAYGQTDPRQLTEYFQSQGYDGVSTPRETVIFDPENVVVDKGSSEKQQADSSQQKNARPELFAAMRSAKDANDFVKAVKERIDSVEFGDDPRENSNVNLNQEFIKEAQKPEFQKIYEEGGTDDDVLRAIYTDQIRQETNQKLREIGVPESEIPRPGDLEVAQEQVNNAQTESQMKEQVNTLPEEYKKYIRVPEKFSSDADRQSLQQLIANPEKMLNDYIDRFGIEINTDNARMLFDVYNGTNSPEVHNAAAALRSMVYDHLLETRLNEGNGQVLNTAGSAGSGKTFALKRSGIFSEKDLLDFTFVLDTTMSDSKQEKYITIPLERGLNVVNTYVLRKPMDAWVDGVLKRVQTEGRVVPEEIFLEAYPGAKEQIVKLYDKYKDHPSVEFKFIDNTGTPDQIAETTVEKVRDFEYNRDTLRKEVQDATDQAYKQGDLTSEQYQAITKGRHKADSQQSSQQNDSQSQVQPQGRTEQVTQTADQFLGNEKTVRPKTGKEVDAIATALETSLNDAGLTADNQAEYNQNLKQVIDSAIESAGNDKSVLSAIHRIVSRRLYEEAGATGGNFKENHKELMTVLQGADGEYAQLLHYLNDTKADLKDKLVTARTVPQVIERTTTPVNVKRSTMTSQTPVGTGRSKESRYYKRVRDLIDERFQDDVNYNPLNLEKDTENAVNYVENNPKDAYLVAKGLKDAPEGMTAAKISIAMEELARIRGDHAMQSDLATSLSLRSTRMGQEIVSLRGRVTENSATNFMNQLLEARLEKIGKTYGNIKVNFAEEKGEKTSVKNPNSNKARAMAKIDQETKKLSQLLKNEKEKVKLATDIQSFIDEITC